MLHEDAGTVMLCVMRQSQSVIKMKSIEMIISMIAMMIIVVMMMVMMNVYMLR